MSAPHTPPAAAPGTRERELRAADAQARLAAQSVFDRPLLLEAGAGTGKTHTLVARTLVWCLGPGWERHAQRAEPPAGGVAAAVLGRVTALTFTEAAAREMAERVARALAALARGELSPGLAEELLPEPELRRARAQALLAELERLEVRTIHAWCRRILSEHALAAGLAPDFAVDADGRASAALLRELLEEQLAGPYPPALAALARRGLAPSEVEQALLELLAAGITADALAEEPASPQRLGELLAHGRAALAHWHSLAGEELAQVKGARTQATCAALAALEAVLARCEHASASTEAAQGAAGAEAAQGALEAEAAEAAASALAQWFCAGETENWTRLAEWGRGKLARGEEAALGARADAFVAASAALARWAVCWVPRADGRPLLALAELREARAALEPLLRELERRLRARGVQSFAALLRDAAQLLAGSPQLCAELRESMDQLLVDEFQDTDALQCEILRAVALGGAPQERPGLFLVGDPKQSIYGWREADLAAYERFADELCAGGARREVLSVCFRAPAAILDEVERLIAPVMQARAGLQPPFRPLLPAPVRAAAHPSASSCDQPSASSCGQGPSASSCGQERSPDTPAVEHWVTWLPGAEGGALRPAAAAAACRAEARAVAADLVRQNAAGTPWSELALLLRSRSDLDVYLEALRRAGVPYTVEGHRAYYRRREVIELAAWLRAIADPTDQLALLTWLRAPCAGVPDAALLPLWERGLPERAAALGSGAPGELEALVALVHDAALAVPAVPGLERVAAWSAALCAALAELAELRCSLERDPPDRFVERLRTATCLEALEGARALGAYRLANAERFFGELGAELAAGAELHALLSALRRRIRDQEEEEEGRPLESGLDAVSVRTIHQAKGLDFGHVYLVQTHKEGRRSGPAAAALAGRRGGRWEYRLFGAATPGWSELEAERAALEQAERVRTLYVALTRAKRRLVTVGVWPESPPARPAQGASHVKLMTGRSSGVPDFAARAASAAAQPSWRDPHGVLWVLLGALPAADPAPGAVLGQGAFALAEPEQIRAESTALAQARAAAQLRAALPLARGMSAPAGGTAPVPPQHTPVPSGLGLAPSRITPAPARPAAAVSRAVAAPPRMAHGSSRVGTGAPPAPASGTRGPRAERLPGPLRAALGSAVHRALESLDLDAAEALPEQLRRECAAEFARLHGALPAFGRRVLRTHARQLAERVAGGALLERLESLRKHVVARELAVWLPAAALSADELQAPLSHYSGVIDLVYRDPVSLQWVLVDYKTDRVAGELGAHAERYRTQGRLYCEALQGALQLEQVPRFELWFLSVDRAVAL